MNLISLLYVLFIPIIALAAEPTPSESCSSAKKEVMTQEAIATAGAFANIRGSSNSITTLSKSILVGAIDQLKSGTAPEGLCSDSCVADRNSPIIFTSIPLKRLSGYSDEAVCADLLEKTKKSPFTFKGRSFENLDALHQYIGDLSQGKGADGEKLYVDCPGSCSPQFETAIHLEPNNYLVDTSVICGHARDKDDDMYALAAKIDWSCANKNVTAP